LCPVTERTREIGIRISVGATEGNVQQQFLIEAVVLSLLGGILGHSVRLLSSVVITQTLGWPILISPFCRPHCDRILDDGGSFLRLLTRPAKQHGWIRLKRFVTMNARLFVSQTWIG